MISGAVRPPFSYFSHEIMLGVAGYQDGVSILAGDSYPGVGTRSAGARRLRRLITSFDRLKGDFWSLTERADALFSVLALCSGPGRVSPPSRETIGRRTPAPRGGWGQCVALVTTFREVILPDGRALGSREVRPGQWTGAPLSREPPSLEIPSPGCKRGYVPLETGFQQCQTFVGPAFSQYINNSSRNPE